MKGKRAVLVVMGLIACLLATGGVGHSMIGPDQNIEDFPPWIWPYIHPVSIFAKAVTGEGIVYEQAAKEMRESVLVQCKHFTAGDYSFKELLTTMDSQFQMQLATLHFAKTKAVGLAMGKLVALDDDDPCGNPPRRPWPWPTVLLDLVKVQMEVFKTEVLAQYQLTKDEVEMLDADLNGHYKNFFMLLK